MRNIIFNHDKCSIDNGIFFGKGIFETILIKDKPILLNEHIERANKSIKELNIGETIRLIDVEKFIYDNKVNNKALKIVVTEKNIIYSLREIKYKEKHYESGFKVKFSDVLRNSTSPITYIKSLNYLDNILEYELAQSQGLDEAIFLNEKGEVTEGCTTNLFIVKNNKIMTPKIECGILPGVVREWIINNFRVEEKIILKGELLDADEVILTNSLVGIINVSEICGKKFEFRLSEKIREKYNCFIDGGSNINE